MAFERKVVWEEEVPKMRQLGEQGYSMVDLSKEYGVTRQRVKQIVDRYIPNWGQDYGFAKRRKDREAVHFLRWGDKNDSDLYRSQRKKFKSKQTNALKMGKEWDLNFGDLEWPTHCPMLGIELDYFNEFRKDNSPSFDQIIPGKGYVKGNVVIVSFRANLIKNSGTAEEHRRIADWLDKHTESVNP